MGALDIAKVCRHWRKVALSTKALWCNIDIQVCNDEDHHPHQLRMVQKLPLTISYAGVISAPLVNTLRAESDRWYSVTTGIDLLEIPNLRLSKLRHLELQISRWRPVPNLPSGVTDIVLKGFRPGAHISWDRNFGPQSSILHLKMHELPASCVLRVAKHCPALLSLGLNDCYLDTIPNDLLPARVPTLRSLVLNSCAVDAVAKLFSSLIVPQLNSISIHELLTNDRDLYRRPYATLFPVTALREMLAREAPMPKSLNMSGVILTRNRLESILKFFPSLESLTTMPALIRLSWIIFSTA